MHDPAPCRLQRAPPPRARHTPRNGTVTTAPPARYIPAEPRGASHALTRTHLRSHRPSHGSTTPVPVRRRATSLPGSPSVGDLVGWVPRRSSRPGTRRVAVEGAVPYGPCTCPFCSVPLPTAPLERAAFTRRASRSIDRTRHERTDERASLALPRTPRTTSHQKDPAPHHTTPAPPPPPPRSIYSSQRRATLPSGHPCPGPEHRTRTASRGAPD